MLFIEAAGHRSCNNGGGLYNVGSRGNYWSSSPYASGNTNAGNLWFSPDDVNPQNNNNRAHGFSVRCVQHLRVVFILEKMIMNEKLLTDIFNAYYDARQNKRNSFSQLRFEMRLEENLIALYHEIEERRYHVGRSICFITDIPVKREIFAADFRDRVVHHLLCNYVGPLLERTFITDSYSCRKGMGTHFGIGRLEHHIRSCSNNFSRQCFLLKLDIRGYFMNIDRQKLYDILSERLMRFSVRKVSANQTWGELLDYDLILYLIREIVFNDPTKNCQIRGSRSQWVGLPPSKSLFHTPDGCGLPIGNLTSQLFSNVYLSKLDDFVKRTLRVKHYGRYVDDFFIVGTDRARLMQLVPIIRNFLKDELGLMLHPDKIYLQEVTKGVNFLGANIKPYRRYLVNKTKRRINRQMKSAAYRPQHLMVATVNSYLGYMRHLSCQNYIRHLIDRNQWLLERGRFTPYYRKFVPFKKERDMPPSDPMLG